MDDYLIVALSVNGLPIKDMIETLLKEEEPPVYDLQKTICGYECVLHSIETRNKTTQAIYRFAKDEDLAQILRWYEKKYPVKEYPVIDKDEFVASLIQRHKEKLEIKDYR